MKSNTGSPTVQRELMPVTSLRGVGESVAARLEKLGVRTIQDLLFLPAVI